MESPTHDERSGTNQRGIPTPHQDAVKPAQQRRRVAAALWSAPQRRCEAQSTRRMEGHAEGSSGSRVITRSDDAPAFPPLDRHDPLMALGVSLLVRRLLV